MVARIRPNAGYLRDHKIDPVTSVTTVVASHFEIRLTAKDSVSP
jgi:hypothetical protein